ncbi:hypothetical protein [Kribbella deserti]|uniref:Prevent-host-death family protein n=1 Tax=Kribbella deserti TaxID=1926257 RepID=A0ABV6QVN1_9ACTN
MAAKLQNVVNFSELLRDPTSTVEKLGRSNARSLRLARRGSDDLVLSTAARASQDDELFQVVIRMLRAVMSNPAVRSQYLLDILPTAFPWIGFLPSEDVAAFAEELIQVMDASAELESPAAILQTITAWRHTAEIHSDPELFAALSSRLGDHGPVPEPPA